MVDSRVRGSRRPGFAVTVLMLFALVVLMLAVALPAQAATAPVRSGSTQLVVNAKVVTHLQAMNVSIINIAPVTFSPKWVSAGMQWWYRVPMSNDGTVYDYTKKKGTFYHNGSIRWVEASGTTHKQVRWQGLRVLALGASSYQLSAAVGEAPTTRLIVATANNTPKFTKSGKAITIDGVQFKLTTAGEASLFAYLGEHISMTSILFDTDLLFNMK